MSVFTTQASQIRTEAKIMTNSDIGDLEAEYEAYEAAKAADPDKTWAVRVVNGEFVGGNYIFYVEASYVMTDTEWVIPEV